MVKFPFTYRGFTIKKHLIEPSQPKVKSRWRFKSPKQFLWYQYVLTARGRIGKLKYTIKVSEPFLDTAFDKIKARIRIVENGVIIANQKYG